MDIAKNTFGSRTQWERNAASFGRAVDLSDLFTLNAIPNADSQIPFKSITHTATSVMITWQSQPGLAYRVQWKNQLSDGVWQTITPDITGTGAMLIWIDDGRKTGSVPSAERFYRITLP